MKNKSISNKISIIIPIYNSENFIKKCLDSLINQTYQNIEIICINDGSTDRSLNILKTYQKKDKRIIIIDKKNAGVSAARNDGLKIATGNYVTFVDADDWLETNAIERLHSTLTNEKVDVVRGNYFINHTYNDSEKIETGKQYNLSNSKIYSNEKNFTELVVNRLLNGELPCFIWLLMIRKSLIKDITFKENIKYMEDVIFYNELINKIDSIYFLDEPLYHYFDNQTSCTRASEYYIRNMYNIIDVNNELNKIIKKGKFYSEDTIKLMNTTHIDLIMNYFYQVYKTNNQHKKSLIISEINKIINNKDIKNIIKNTNINNLPYHKKISINLILKKKYKLLFLIYNIRILLSNLKK